MSYTRSNLPLWAKALVGGLAMFAGVLVVLSAAIWNPQAAWLRGIPEIGAAVVLSTFGIILVAYGIRLRRRTPKEES